jgi:uncharacterized protein YjbI with pentapeptide repeats
MNAADKEWDSMWRGIIGLELKAHQAWYARGRIGDGRMVLVDENLQGAHVADLRGVHFTRCDLSGAKLGRRPLDDAELTECTFFDATLNYSHWERATLTRCNFVSVFMGCTDFDDASISDCDWTNAYLERSIWTRAVVVQSLFTGANLDEVTFDLARFDRCSFSRATLQDNSQRRGNVAVCNGTHFIDCDFRGANITGLRLNNTTFERCKFHGVIGAPVLEGPVTLVDADFSVDGDGSDMRSQADVVAQWRNG